jgi:hypothetical protein
MDPLFKRIPCASPFASTNAALVIDQFKPGFVWLSVTETRAEGPRESEPIKIAVVDLIAALEAFK